MAPRALTAPLGDVFTVAQARDVGVSPGRLSRHPPITAPFSGVLTRALVSAPDEAPWELRRRTSLRHAQAYARVMLSRAFFARATALDSWRRDVNPSDEFLIP